MTDLSTPGTTGFHILILAAGASTRLGSPKQLARVRGRPALQSVVAAAVSVAGQAVTVVVGSAAGEIMPMLARTGVTTVINRRWEEGLGASIRVGIAALPPACEAVLLLLGDQVAVTAEDLRRLVAAWKGRETVVAAALYQRAPGVPAIFPRWCFQDLAQIRGDRGAKQILQRHASRLIHVSMPNAAIDIDTREDLERLNARNEIGDIPNFPALEAKLGMSPISGLDWSAATWLLPSGLELIEGETSSEAGDPHVAHHRPD